MVLYLLMHSHESLPSAVVVFEIGISRRILSQWVKQVIMFKGDNGPSKGNSTEQESKETTQIGTSERTM
ncbi:hypothetical protein GOBAR_DD15389 [Gossypium barbadense]|nr:hypothetical protein GOBAR_DD15389 [Gossypium barbadense]